MHSDRVREKLEAAGWEARKMVIATDPTYWEAKPPADSPIRGGLIRFPESPEVSQFLYGDSGAILEQYSVEELTHVIAFHRAV